MTSKYTLDIVRVIAMVGVVADHCFQRSSHKLLDNTGLCFGGVAVSIFFTLSAYLFGEKWRMAGNKRFDVLPFLKKRFLRIFIPLWVSLLFIIALEWYAHHPLDIKTVVFNFLGLSWAKPFMWAGHLWYITMIIILYFVFLLLSRIRLDEIPVWVWLISFLILSSIMICLPSLFNTVSKVTIPLTILFADMVFNVGDRLMTLCRNHKWIVGALALLFFAFNWYLHLGGLYHTQKGIATVLSSISGLLLFFAMATIIVPTRNSRIIGWLSSISYELYLIHLTAIMAVAVLMNNNHSIWFYFVSIFLMLVLANMIHFICQKITGLITRKA